MEELEEGRNRFEKKEEAKRKFAASSAARGLRPTSAPNPSPTAARREALGASPPRRAWSDPGRRPSSESGSPKTACRQGSDVKGFA